MHSHHSHSGEFCAHADKESSLISMLDKAVAIGFQTYCLTEHVPRATEAELYPEELEGNIRPKDLLDTFRLYLKTAKDLQASSQGVTEVLVGAETENVSGPPWESLSFLRRVLNDDRTASVPDWHSREDEDVFPASVGEGHLDMLVGSVHHVHGIPIDFDAATFERAVRHCYNLHHANTPFNREIGIESLVKDYLDSQYALLQQFRPEVVGHFDLCRLFAPSLTFAPQEGPQGSLWGRVERNVRYAISYGALFEVNSAAYRKKLDTAYPRREILKLIHSLGGRVCLSDDAHSVAQIAQNFSRSRAYLLEVGFHSIWRLTREGWQATDSEEEEARIRREGSDRPGEGAPVVFRRGTRAVEVQDWEKDPFWASLVVSSGLEARA